VPLVAAAVCPHPPILVPEVAAGAAGELAPLRSACRAAVEALTDPATGVERFIVVGAGPRTVRHEPPFGGTLAPWGLQRVIGAHGARPLPLSLLIGVWLAPHADGFVSVAADATPAECAELGAAIAAEGRVGLLVMGDASACRNEKAPGYFDPRAADFDRTVAGALAGVDVATLLAIEPGVATELRAAGRPAWQVLAGAAARSDGEPAVKGTVLFDDAPYGVGYIVASWR
jgi:hypothetical protein